MPNKLNQIKMKNSTKLITGIILACLFACSGDKKNTENSEEEIEPNICPNPIIGKQSNISSSFFIIQTYNKLFSKKFEIRTVRPTKNKPTQLSGFIIYS